MAVRAFQSAKPLLIASNARIAIGALRRPQSSSISTRNICLHTDPLDPITRAAQVSTHRTVVPITMEDKMNRPRDMTRNQFNTALQRRGWRKVLLWIEVGNGRSIGMVMVGGKINRRASLAHAIRESAQCSMGSG